MLWFSIIKLFCNVIYLIFSLSLYLKPVQNDVKIDGEEVSTPKKAKLDEVRQIVDYRLNFISNQIQNVYFDAFIKSMLVDNHTWRDVICRILQSPRK